jgi:hypothetical protein
VASHGWVDSDTALTPYERRCWKQLRRQLEDEHYRPGRGRAARWTAAAVVVLALLCAAALGGPVGVEAVLAYLGVSLGLWGLFRAVWRTGPAPSPLKDLI